MPGPALSFNNKPFVRTLELYCDWLNSFADPSMDDYHYDPDNWDRTKNQYAFVKEHQRFTEPFDYNVVVFELGDGDEGGPAVLTVYYTHDGQPWHATQMFDTMLSLWLFEGKVKEGQNA